MNGDIIKGVPSMLIVPIGNYTFKVVGEYEAEVKNSGAKEELDINVFDDKTAADGDFNIYDFETSTFNTVEFQKVLTASGKYPYLKEGTYFVPYLFKFNDETNTVIVKGYVIEMV